MATASTVPASTGIITLKYSGAAASASIALLSVLALLGELFGLWTDKLGSLFELGGGYTSIVMLAVLGALFSVGALLLYRSVTKDVGKQPDYVKTSAYNFITNTFFASVVFLFVVLVAELISLLFSSLLLIGTTTDIGALYLGQFLPALVAAGIVGFVGFCAFNILKGKNYSALMTIVLVSLAGALLLAVLITVPIKAHAGSTANSSTQYQYDYSKYLQDLYNTRN